MKILKIDNGRGFYYSSKDSTWKPIDEIDKLGLMNLLNDYLNEDVEVDEFDVNLISNQAQQIIYKSIYEKFVSLNDNKGKFKDESERLYLSAVQKYS